MRQDKCFFDAINSHQITTGSLRTFASAKRLRLKSALLLVFPAFALSPEPPTALTAAQGEAWGCVKQFPGKNSSSVAFLVRICPGSVPKFRQSLWQETLGRNLTCMWSLERSQAQNQKVTSRKLQSSNFSIALSKMTD